MENAARPGERIGEWLLVEAQPGSGSFVMATGIVAVGMELSGHGQIADALLVVCGLGWLVLATAFLYRLAARTDEWWHETTQLGALTAVAGSTVLASALQTILDWRLVPLLLWIVAATLWLVVISRTLSRLPPRAPQGLVFLLTVATQGVSLVASSLAVAYDADWLVYLAFALWAVGIAFYLLIELHDFDHGRITTGAGDQWIFAGAVAITVLAGAKLLTAVRAQSLGGSAHDLRVAVLVIWIVALPMLLVLVWSEFAFPRVAYSALRWATAFPVGMYAACTLVASKALGFPWMDTYFADWWVWVGLGFWAIVCTGLVRRIGRLAFRGQPS
ncbi:MAG TPA: tellurite resistance/C4-dicarboxylate transporter family protein [Gaiellaceae bacterium]